jgi:hypothetical protein
MMLAVVEASLHGARAFDLSGATSQRTISMHDFVAAAFHVY